MAQVGWADGSPCPRQEATRPPLSPELSVRAWQANAEGQASSHARTLTSTESFGERGLPDPEDQLFSLEHPMGDRVGGNLTKNKAAPAGATPLCTAWLMAGTFRPALSGPIPQPRRRAQAVTPQVRLVAPTVPRFRKERYAGLSLSSQYGYPSSSRLRLSCARSATGT